MKYSLSYKLIAITLTFLVLFSSLSYSIEKHFCEGEIHTSLFLEAEALCSMHDDEYVHTDYGNVCCTEESNCCTSSTVYVSGISISQQAQPELKISLFPVLVWVINYYNTISWSENTFPIQIIPTPPKIPDLRILYQVFII